MHPALHDELINDTGQLRTLLAQHSTESIVGMSNAMLMRWFGQDPRPSPLVSPMRQIFFMLGIMLTTDEPSKPWSFGDTAFDRAVSLLNSIFHKYALMYWPQDAPLAGMPPEWKARREVSMVTFLHYFNTMLTASLDQVRDRIRRYLCPLDARFASIIGLSASDALAVTDWVTNHFQQNADHMVDSLNAEIDARRLLIKKAETHAWGLEELRREATTGPYAQVSQELIKHISTFMKIEPTQIAAEFDGNIASAYWKRFVSTRSSSATFSYLTEFNPAEDRPLILLPDGPAMCPSPNVLYTAILEGLERDILASEHRDEFLRHRDEALEDEVAQQLERIFPPNAVHRNVAQTQDLQNEHDVVITHEANLLVVEAKATPPREPLRDPEKAFVRINDDFRGERGIQGAYDQAVRLLTALRSAGRITLFDAKRKQVTSIDYSSLTRSHCACVTRDSFGPLAVDLSLLLQKEASAPYPWSIGILDLTYMIDAWTYFTLGPSDFLIFLDQRAKLHGKVTSFDELELVGFYLEHGSLNQLVDLDADHIFLSIDYSDILDRVYATKLGGPPPSLGTTEPIVRFVGPRIALVTLEA